MSSTRTPKYPISPYQEIFRQIEMSAVSKDITPHEAYRMYDEFLIENWLDPTIYLSMAITSGGYRRDPDMPISEVIRLNSRFGQLAALALIRDIPELELADIVVPSELGKVRGWSQMDYLLFWFHVITGIRPHEAVHIEETVQAQVRARTVQDSDPANWEYGRLVSSYIRALRDLARDRGRLQPNNMQAVLFILDGEMSLGADAERELCFAVGIPPQYQLLSATAMEPINGEFARHLNRLIGLEATALGTSLNFSSDVGFVGYSMGEDVNRVDYRSGIMLGGRKTGLHNAVYAKEYYTSFPSARPSRHCGHTPLNIVA